MGKCVRIIALDGPAGGGKSTLIKEIIDRGLARSPGQLFGFIRPRDYDSQRTKDNGASYSMVKNHAQLVDTFRTSYEHNHDVPIILDRWALSQFVYGTLRTSKGWMTGTLETYWKSEIDYLKLLYSQYDYRRWAGMPYSDDLPVVPLELHPVFFLPDYETVLSRRANHEKEYPFYLRDEWNFYHRIWEWELIMGYTSVGNIFRPPPRIYDTVDMIDLIGEMNP
ncbi:MAG: hypothetical protein JRE40_00340 [Deltaproteobacteria bacterium]|nr:hypothetical protein [Deltaproteobacteria bacterium]